MMNIAPNPFKFSDRIFKVNDFDKALDYSPTIQTDFGEEIRIDCNSSEFILENLIFHKDVRINIKRLSNIKIRNCIFMHSLYLYPDTEITTKNLHLFCYKMQVNESLVLVREATYTVASIDSCVLESFIVTDSVFDKIEFFKTEVANDIYLEGTIIGEFVVHNCFINIIKNCFIDIKIVDIDIASFEEYHKDILAIKPKNFIDHTIIEKAKSEIESYKNELSKDGMLYGKSKKQFKEIAKHNIKILRQSIADQKKYSVKHFLKFIQLIKISTHESIDAQVLAELNYRYYRNRQYNSFVYIGLWMLGFFFKPFRLIITSIVTIFAFGILFYLIAHAGDRVISLNELMSKSIIINIILELSDFIYFSVITFYTIGYSDLSDTNKIYNASVFIKQYLVFAEALFGVIINSSVIVSLMNRYGIKN